MRWPARHPIQWLSLLVLLCSLCDVSLTAKGYNGAARVPMSSLKTLYFHDGGKTLARRGKSMPQLKCVGNSKHLCNTYSPDIILCKSEGDGAWRCEAELHPDVRLGKVEVSCEGWENAADDYVLRGSCMLEYNILPAYAKSSPLSHAGIRSPTMDSILAMLFFFTFIGVLGFIIFSFFRTIGAWNTSSQPRGDRLGRGGWGGFGPGGGGGWGGGGPGDAPPPYYPHQKPSDGSSSSAWRPGFWSGLAAGGFATHAANRLSQRNQPPAAANWGTGRRRAFLDDEDDHPMFRQAGPSRASASSAETRTSMNFGGTRNR